MTIRSEQEALRDALTTLYDNREASNIADWVIEHITGKKKSDRLIQKNNTFTPEEQTRLNQYAAELLTGRPVQYVLGEAWFMGMKFYVNESVLIPRPETEELVEWVVESHTSSQPRGGKIQKSLLDIGTGSGCIPLAIKKKLPHISVTGTDISLPALEVAKRNATALEADIDFVSIDFLDHSSWQLLPVFDTIVSNPPYIRQSEQSGMAKHVVDYEPSIALFVPDEDALLFYRKIALFAKDHLAKNGMVFLEINERLGKEAVELYKSHGFMVELRKDLQGKDRMLRADIV
jgi:release factor glutamine methyltransferase